MRKSDNASQWEQALRNEDTTPSANGSFGQPEVEPFPTIYAELAATVPCAGADEPFRQQLEDQLVTVLQAQSNPVEEPTARFRSRPAQVAWLLAAFNRLLNPKNLAPHFKLALTTAALIMVFAISSPLLAGPDSFFDRLRNVIGADVTPETIATAHNHPSATPSLTPTPTSTPLLATQVLGTRIDQPFPGKRAINQLSPAPTPAGTITP